MLQAQTWSEVHCASSDQTDYVLLKAQKARKTSLGMALKIRGKLPQFVRDKFVSVGS